MNGTKNSKGKALVTASNEIIPRKKRQEKERMDNRLISRKDEKETINNTNEWYRIQKTKHRKLETNASKLKRNESMKKTRKSKE